MSVRSSEAASLYDLPTSNASHVELPEILTDATTSSSTKLTGRQLPHLQTIINSTQPPAENSLKQQKHTQQNLQNKNSLNLINSHSLDQKDHKNQINTINKKTSASIDLIPRTSSPIQERRGSATRTVSRQNSQISSNSVDLRQQKSSAQQHSKHHSKQQSHQTSSALASSSSSSSSSSSTSSSSSSSNKSKNTKNLIKSDKNKKSRSKHSSANSSTNSTLQNTVREQNFGENKSETGTHPSNYSLPVSYQPVELPTTGHLRTIQPDINKVVNRVDQILENAKNLEQQVDDLRPESEKLKNQQHTQQQNQNQKHNQNFKRKNQLKNPDKKFKAFNFERNKSFTKDKRSIPPSQFELMDQTLNASNRDISQDFSSNNDRDDCDGDDHDQNSNSEGETFDISQHNSDQDENLDDQIESDNNSIFTEESSSCYGEYLDLLPPGAPILNDSRGKTPPGSKKVSIDTDVYSTNNSETLSREPSGLNSRNYRNVETDVSVLTTVLMKDTKNVVEYVIKGRVRVLYLCFYVFGFSPSE